MSMPVHLFNDFIVGGDSGVSGDMSSTITSLPVNIDEAVSYSFQAVMTGTPVGTISLLGSNDTVLSSAAGPVNWTTISDSVSSVTGPGTVLINVELPAYSYVHMVYTPISGTGTMTSAKINAKRR